jgi:dienelactone hydrolase
MRKTYRVIFVLVFATVVVRNTVTQAEPVYHETSYPDGNGPFPVVIAMHTSNGFRTIKGKVRNHTNTGFAVYAPDFLKNTGYLIAIALRHGQLIEQKLKLSCLKLSKL